MAILGENTSEILTVAEPVIKKSKITESHDEKSQDAPDDSKLIGYSNPFVKINGFRLSYKSIIKFKLSTAGFRPTLNILFIDADDMFDADFPKDGDLIELYIRSPNDLIYRKIRIDFDILTIRASQQKDGTAYTLSGIMRVPDLLSELSISLPSNSSYNHLIDISGSLDLGFASNLTDTDDSMPRFNAKNTVQEFIHNTTESSYKDEESFLTSYIDLHYYLNFVEVNCCFQTEGALQEGDIDAATFSNQDKDKEANSDEGVQNKILLSNHANMQNSTNFIMNYSLYNNSGNVWMTNGYKRYAESYDMQEKQFNSFYVDPLTTSNSESDSVILKGRAGDDSYENQNKYKYFGRSYSTLYDGNLHPNYHYAKVQNHQNLEEINKMGLVIVLNGISTTITKYRSIPIAIFKQGQQAKMRRQAGDELTGRSQEEEGTYTSPDGYLLDNFLSGWYVVKDYDIVWQADGSFQQVVTLVRREWPLPYPGGNINQSEE